MDVLNLFLNEAYFLEEAVLDVLSQLLFEIYWAVEHLLEATLVMFENNADVDGRCFYWDGAADIRYCVV